MEVIKTIKIKLTEEEREILKQASEIVDKISAGMEVYTELRGELLCLDEDDVGCLASTIMALYEASATTLEIHDAV